MHFFKTLSEETRWAKRQEVVTRKIKPKTFAFYEKIRALLRAKQRNSLRAYLTLIIHYAVIEVALVRIQCAYSRCNVR